VKRVDRIQVKGFLQDPTLSYREIARRTGHSDWSVRRVARELDGHPHSMNSTRCASTTVRAAASDESDHSTWVTGWLIVVAITALCGLGLWRARRWDIPPHAFSDLFPNNHN
jgi:hypothetical protein